MSELKTNKVSPATGTALAVGDSGDTITVPSGATLDISASTLTPPATMPASSGINFTALNATNLGSGTVPTARLGSGTASSSTFLRGDQTYAAAGGGFNSVQVFTSSGTWTKPSGITKVVMHVIGAGGAGGGGRSSYNYAGSGGGGGGTAIKFLDVSSISTSTITVAAVVSGPAKDVAGSTGGASSWADGTNTVTGSGGVGGPRGGANIGVVGGAASGGDINSPGGNGPTGGPGGNIGSQDGGSGGICANGFGGGPGASNYDATSDNDAYGYGHGGAGGAKNKSGGDSAGGIVVVWEYK